MPIKKKYIRWENLSDDTIVIGEGSLLKSTREKLKQYDIKNNIQVSDRDIGLECKDIVSIPTIDGTIYAVTTSLIKHNQYHARVLLLPSPDIVEEIEVETPEELRRRALFEHYGASRVAMNDMSVIIHYPEIEITNTIGYSHTIYDLLVRLHLNKSCKVVDGTLRGRRLSFTAEEIVKRYVHSHLEGQSVEGLSNFSTFCLGSAGGDTLANVLYHYSSSPQLSYEQLMMLFEQIDSYVKWESLEGKPYMCIDCFENNNTAGIMQTMLSINRQPTVDMIDSMVTSLKSFGSEAPVVIREIADGKVEYRIDWNHPNFIPMLDNMTYTPVSQEMIGYNIKDKCLVSDYSRVSKLKSLMSTYPPRYNYSMSDGTVIKGRIIEEEINIVNIPNPTLVPNTINRVNALLNETINRKLKG